MNLYVLNQELEITGIIDTYDSIIWRTSYFSIGDFELYAAATKELIQTVKKEFYICREEDIKGNIIENAMIITKIEIETHLENGNYLIITGQCLKSILQRRIVWNQTNLNGTIESCIYKIITENVIAPQLPERKIENFALEPQKKYTETIETQVTGKNIAEWIEETCKTYGFGWDIYLNNQTFVFKLCRGVDRSSAQDINNAIEISTAFENLLSSNYIYDISNYKNTALIAGEGEGTQRKTIQLGSESGLNRRELYIDARDLSTNEGEISDNEYKNMLIERGNNNLTEYTIAEVYEGEVNNTNYEINKDYFIGDIVDVKNEYGIAATPRITEIIWSKSSTGETTIPTFSVWEV